MGSEEAVRSWAREEVKPSDGKRHKTEKGTREQKKALHCIYQMRKLML